MCRRDHRKLPVQWWTCQIHPRRAMKSKHYLLRARICSRFRIMRVRPLLEMVSVQHIYIRVLYIYCFAFTHLSPACACIDLWWLVVKSHIQPVWDACFEIIWWLLSSHLYTNTAFTLIISHICCFTTSLGSLLHAYACSLLCLHPFWSPNVLGPWGLPVVLRKC